jgi:hypothetical protein
MPVTGTKSEIYCWQRDALEEGTKLEYLLFSVEKQKLCIANKRIETDLTRF